MDILLNDNEKRKKKKKVMTLKKRLTMVMDGAVKSCTDKKDEVISKVGTYALDRFGKSKYARSTFSVIPTSMMAGLLKATVSFLILYRMSFDNFWIDTLISLIVTVCLAAISPIFYIIANEQKEHFQTFANHFMDQMSVRGLEYIINWRNNTVFAIGLFAILFLLCFDVDSYYLIHCIVDYLVGCVVVDRVNYLRDAIFLPVPVSVDRVFYPRANLFMLTKYDYEVIPLKVVEYCTTFPTHNEVIDSYSKPSKAIIINIDKWVEKQKKKMNMKQMGGTTVRVLEDYVWIKN